MEWISLLNPIAWIEKLLKWGKLPIPVVKFEYKLDAIGENAYCQLRHNLNVGRKSWFFRLGIDNFGKTPIENANVRVEKIERILPKEKLPVSSSPFFLHWSNENTDNSRMIYLHTPVYVDVAYTVEGSHYVYLFHKAIHSHAGIKNNLIPGEYRLTVKLLGGNISPIEREVVIKSNGNWEQLKMDLI